MGPEDEKALTIARRTRTNLDYIYQKKSEGEKVEEFTQLLNSMLSMVINLREEYYKGSHISWGQIEGLGLMHGRCNLKTITGKKANRESPNLQEINSFSQIVTKLRNAFAHSCFEFIEDNGQITGVTVWNVPLGLDNQRQNRIWEADIFEANLKSLAYLIVEYIEKELG